MDVTLLELTPLGTGSNGENLRQLECKFCLDQSERKSSQVNASALKASPNEVASRRKFSTWDCLRVLLARALN